MRLGGVAQHGEAGLTVGHVVLRGQGDAGEVHMGGDVLGAHGHQRVAVGLVGLVAHHGAHVALGVVVLALTKAIVEQKHGAAAHAGGQGADEGLGLGMDFGEVVVWPVDGQRGAQVGGAVGPGEGIRMPGHATFVPLALHAGQQLHRHGVEHFVAHHHAVELRGQRIHPAHRVAKPRQRQLLARPQAAGQIHDGVALHLCAQRAQQLHGQRTRAGAELPHLVGAGLLQGFGHLGGQGLAEQRGHFGGGDEVAARRREGAELGQLVGVVTQARGVQGQCHEAVKADPAAVGSNVSLDVGLQRQGERGGWGGRRRGRGHALHCPPSLPGPSRPGRLAPPYSVICTCLKFGSALICASVNGSLTHSPAAYLRVWSLKWLLAGLDDWP